MPPEVKSGALAAAGDNRSAVGKGSSSETARFCCPTVSILGFGGFLDSLRMTEGIYMVKCACEPNRLMESFPVHIKINVQPQPLLESGS